MVTETLEELKKSTEGKYLQLVVAVVDGRPTGGEELILGVPGGENLLGAHVSMEIGRDAGSLEWTKFSNRYLRPAFVPLLNHLRQNGSIK